MKKIEPNDLPEVGGGYTPAPDDGGCVPFPDPVLPGEPWGPYDPLLPRDNVSNT